jgi:hypothetical protein
MSILWLTPAPALNPGFFPPPTAPLPVVIAVSFAKPDMAYTKGSYNFAGSGLQFSWDPPVLRDAITTLKARQPTARVMLAVGGATYQGWDNLNTKAIKDLVSFLLAGSLPCCALAERVGAR